MNDAPTTPTPTTTSLPPPSPGPPPNPGDRFREARAKSAAAQLDQGHEERIKILAIARELIAAGQAPSPLRIAERLGTTEGRVANAARTIRKHPERYPDGWPKAKGSEKIAGKPAAKAKVEPKAKAPDNRKVKPLASTTPPGPPTPPLGGLPPLADPLPLPAALRPRPRVIPARVGVSVAFVASPSPAPDLRSAAHTACEPVVGFGVRSAHENIAARELAGPSWEIAGAGFDDGGLVYAVPGRGYWSAVSVESMGWVTPKAGRKGVGKRVKPAKPTPILAGQPGVEAKDEPAPDPEPVSVTTPEPPPCPPPSGAATCVTESAQVPVELMAPAPDPTPSIGNPSSVPPAAPAPSPTLGGSPASSPVPTPTDVPIPVAALDEPAVEPLPIIPHREPSPDDAARHARIREYRRVAAESTDISSRVLTLAWGIREGMGRFPTDWDLARKLNISSAEVAEIAEEWSRKGAWFCQRRSSRPVADLGVGGRSGATGGPSHA